MKKLLSALLACIIVWGTVPYANAFTHSDDIEHFDFSDVSVDDWYYNEVMTLRVKGILGGMGDGRFAPKDTVTRAQALKMILAAAETELREAPEGDAWYADYLYTAQELGYVDDTFAEHVEEPATRLEAARLIAAASSLEAGDSGEHPFADTQEPAVELLYEYGISMGAVDGSGNRRFSGDDTLSRCDLAAFVYRLRRVLQLERARELAPLYGLPADIAWTERPMTQEEIIDDILIEFMNGDYNTAFFYTTERDAETARDELFRGGFNPRDIFEGHPHIGGFMSNLELQWGYVSSDGSYYMPILQMDEPEITLEALAEQQEEALQFALNLSAQLHEDGTIRENMSQKEIAQVYYKWFQEYGVKVPDTGEQGGINVLYDTAYAALIQKEAACVGRAAGFALCLNVEGIPCRGVSGHFAGPDSGHVLSYMLLDGEGYLSDWGNKIPTAKVDAFDKSFVPNQISLEYAIACCQRQADSANG